MITVIDAKNYDIVKFDDNYYDYDILQEKIIVPISGGIDSQALCLYLEKIGKSIKKVFFDYTYNKVDALFIDKVDDIIKIDLNKCFFEKNIHLKYFKKYKTTSPQLAIHLYGIEQVLEKYPEHQIIMPGTPLFFYYDLINKEKLEMCTTAPSYNELSYYRYIKKKN